MPIYVDYGLPTILSLAASPTRTVRVVGYNGYVLRVRTIDIFKHEVIADETYNIDADPWERVIVFPTPQTDTDTIVQIVLQVEDADGNIYEVLTGMMYFTEHFITEPLEGPGEMWVITTSGITFKQRVKPDQNGNVLVPAGPNAFTILHTYRHLKMFVGGAKITDAVGDAAIIKLHFEFPEEVANIYGNYVDDPGIQHIIYKEPSLAPWVGPLRMIERIYEDRRMTPLGISINHVADKILIDVITEVDLRTPIDLWGIVKILAGIGAIVAGGALLFVSFGLSAPVSYAMFAFGAASIAAGVILLRETASENPSGTIKAAEEEVKRAKEDIIKYQGDLYSYIDQLVNEGKLTEEEAAKIKEYVDEIVQRATKAFDYLNEMVKKAYKEGYNAAWNEMWKWIGLAGGGGLVVGVLIGKK